jgi:predicted kinase
MAHNGTKPTLIVFGGLPGTGKTTLARSLALELGATYLRIDDIEEALRSSGLSNEEIGVSGYLVSYALAESNLRLGSDVVADSVNALLVTRNAWRGAAEKATARLIEVEVICSDKVEHRSRVESRTGDIQCLRLPSWQEVTELTYDDWDRAHVVVDTAHCSPEEASIELRRQVAGPSPGH